MDSYVAPGTKIGPYVVVGVLGHGDLGITLLAIDDAGDKFAVKLLLPIEEFPDADARAGVALEYAALAALNLPEVPPIAKFGRYGDHVFVATQHFPGGNLADRLAVSALSLEATLVLVRHLAKCVGAVHRAGVAHGGIKPTNILRRSFGGRDLPVLIDFGAALRHLPWTSFDEDGRDNWFSAPEVRRGALATPPSDVYSLGRLLELMLAGRTVGIGIDEVLTVATAEERALRYYDATAFLADLERAIEGTPTQAAEVLAAFDAARHEPAEPDSEIEPQEEPPADRETAADAEEVQHSFDASVEDDPAPTGRRRLPRRRWRPTMPWILGIGALAGVVALTSSMLVHADTTGQHLKNGFGPGQASGSKPGTPGVVVASAYKSVVFTLTRAAGDATVVQVVRDGLWEDVSTSTIAIPTVIGGQQECVQARSADKSSVPATFSDTVNLCGTSQPAAVTVIRLPACTVAGKKGVCYQVLAGGFESNTSPTGTLTLAGGPRPDFKLVIGGDGNGSLAKGTKLAFAAADAGKQAALSVAGISYTWTVDKP